MSEKHVFDLIPAYVLGALDAKEARKTSQHLGRCPICQAELKAYQRVVSELAESSPQRTPPAHLKDRILKEIHQPHKNKTKGWLASSTKRGLVFSPAWNVASLLLILVLATGNLYLWKQSRHKPASFSSITLTSTEVLPQAKGVLVISTDGEHGTLVVDGLPDLGQDQQYQLWLIEDGKRTSGGVFSVSKEGYGSLWVESPKPLNAYQAFGITIEPYGGSPSPTGDKVLGGQS